MQDYIEELLESALLLNPGLYQGEFDDEGIDDDIDEYSQL